MIYELITYLLGDSFMGAFFLKLTELMGDREFSLLDEDEVESFCKKSLLFGNACAFMAICKNSDLLKFKPTYEAFFFNMDGDARQEKLLFFA